jgi:hypothetical protein
MTLSVSQRCKKTRAGEGCEASACTTSVQLATYDGIKKFAKEKKLIQTFEEILEYITVKLCQ